MRLSCSVFLSKSGNDHEEGDGFQPTATASHLLRVYFQFLAHNFPEIEFLNVRP